VLCGSGCSGDRGTPNRRFMRLVICPVDAPKRATGDE
jgi:hypothetical protein